jgi:hypothetical protein
MTHAHCPPRVINVRLRVAPRRANYHNAIASDWVTLH